MMQLMSSAINHNFSSANCDDFNNKNRNLKTGELILLHTKFIHTCMHENNLIHIKNRQNP